MLSSSNDPCYLTLIENASGNKFIGDVVWNNKTYSVTVSASAVNTITAKIVCTTDNISNPSNVELYSFTNKSKSYIGIKFTDAYNGSKFYCQNVYCSSTNNVQFYDVKVALTNVKKLNY